MKKNKETTKYSFDIDPAFKGLYEILEPDKVNIPSFENIYPSDSELIHYAKEANKLPKKVHGPLVSRIKILINLKIN